MSAALQQTSQEHSTATVRIDDDRVHVNVTVTHRETVAIMQQRLEHDGGLAAFVETALIVGTAALAAGTAAVDTNHLHRALDQLGETLDARATRTFARLDQLVTEAAERDTVHAEAAAGILADLPQRIDTALAGEAASVRAGVLTAVQESQTSALQALNGLLAQHSDGMRREVMQSVHDARTELARDISTLRATVEAAQATDTALKRSSHRQGVRFEAVVNDLLDDVCRHAGDTSSETGTVTAPNGRRSGDGLARITTAANVHHVVVEAKARKRALTADDWRKELAAARNARNAQGGLGLVPTADDVPGRLPIARVEQMSFVVAADDPEVVHLAYWILRTLVTSIGLGPTSDDTAELHAQMTTLVEGALVDLELFEQVTRNLTDTQRHLSKLEATVAALKDKLTARFAATKRQLTETGT